MCRFRTADSGFIGKSQEKPIGAVVFVYFARSGCDFTHQRPGFGDEGGEVVESGEVGAFRARHEYTRALIGAIPRVDFHKPSVETEHTRLREQGNMPKQLHVNLFEMNCVSHIVHGLWVHPTTTGIALTRHRVFGQETRNSVNTVHLTPFFWPMFLGFMSSSGTGPGDRVTGQAVAVPR